VATSGSPCHTGRARHADRISAVVARSRTTGGIGAVGDPFRCAECAGWHVPVVIPAQRTARADANVTLPA
jgi:hypothetical protein